MLCRRNFKETKKTHPFFPISPSSSNQPSNKQTNKIKTEEAAKLKAAAAEKAAKQRALAERSEAERRALDEAARKADAEAEVGLFFLTLSLFSLFSFFLLVRIRPHR